MANVFGDSKTGQYIQNQVKTIFSQAGIRVDFESTVKTYLNDFAYDGRPGSYPINSEQWRPKADRTAIIQAGDLVNSVGSADPLTIDVYFVKIVPEWDEQSEDTSVGSASINNNGFTFFSGKNFLNGSYGESGIDAVAKVFAHELAHNLGLNHINDKQNLLNPTIYEGNLNDTQIAQIRNSALVSSIPEPSTGLFIIIGTICLLNCRLGRKTR